MFVSVVFLLVDANTNRFTAGQGYTYDFNGNLVGDPEGRTFTFNGDNKQTEVKNSSNRVIGTHVFDGDGKRIKKVTASEIRVFVYDAGGKLVGEYSTLTPQATPVTRYLTNDHLGSPRIITDGSGNVLSRRDFMPFGEESFIGTGNRAVGDGYTYGDSTRQKFTGYERDDETGLDFAQARMYSNQLGRFNSTDPILMKKNRQFNPQTINLYTYVKNNPYKYVDKTGKDLILANARKTFQIVRTNGLSEAENKNIMILKNGKVVLRNPEAINLENSSATDQNIVRLVNDRSLTIEVYSVAGR